MTNTLQYYLTCGTFINACMVLQVVMFPLREFHNLAKYMEMDIDFALVRKRVIHNESFCPVSYTYTYGLFFFANYLVINYEKP